MSRARTKPHHAAISVRSYQELAEHAAAFAAGHLNLLFVLGDPGLGKSQCFRRAVGASACWIDGTATAFGMYCLAYENRDMPLVLDDVDGLHADKDGIRLLKCICQTDALKRISWQSNASALTSRNIPRQFTTTSRVAIIANQWWSLRMDVAALEDRGHVLLFEPSPVEVHRQAATWFWDQQIFDFVGAHLHLSERPSFRVYVLAYQFKVAGLDWQTAVLSRFLKGTAVAVARLVADLSFTTQEERASAFVASSAGCRATFFNHARRLKAPPAVPHFQVNGTRPVDHLPGVWTNGGHGAQESLDF